MPTWNPELYLKFAAQRTRPVWDLALQAKKTLDHVKDRPLRIFDLGCGPGNSSAVLSECFPAADLTGLDSSPAMIEEASGSGVKARWVLADAQTWSPDLKADLVFSNAMLQWVPDQAALLAKIWNWVAPGGLLAVQVPANHLAPLHRSLVKTADSAVWKESFSGMQDPLYFREPDYYYEALDTLGGQADVWETTYLHLLQNHEAIIDWYSGTGMRPWLDKLSDDGQRKEFKNAVLRDARAAYPERKDGTVVFPFRRIFMTARKK